MSLIQDLSDPFQAFPRVSPHACVNMSQTFLTDVWTVVCVNDPQFNDIAREIYSNGAWESWLSDHLVKAMLNYPEAVLLGNTNSALWLMSGGHKTHLIGL